MLNFNELTIENINRLTAEELGNSEVYEMLCKTELLPLERGVFENALIKKAKELGVSGEARKMLSYAKKEEKRFLSDKEAKGVVEFENPYGTFKCGKWVATEGGIVKQDDTNLAVIKKACGRPILIVEVFRNIETGEEKVRIAHKKRGQWIEFIEPRETIASANKIVKLANKGVPVTSETAKALVQYLADIEELNEDLISINYSTSKFGWKEGGTFNPFDTTYRFDSDSRFIQLLDSLGECGNPDDWYNHIKRLRQLNRIELKLMMAATFASVLVSRVGALPFIVDLYGNTGGGKTLSLMVCASIWASPAENAYIGDYKATGTALEAKLDCLNHLPLILDDSNGASDKQKEDFENLVYLLCSGKGKSRSNKELGVNRESYWQNSIITSGEQALSSYVKHGGAVNRLIEIEYQDQIYPNPQLTAEIIRNSYGHAGRDFVDALKEIGLSKLKAMYGKVYDGLQDATKTQKQTMSMAVILLADQIATDYLFKDGVYISPSEAKTYLTDINDVNDMPRLYEWIIDQVYINESKFPPDDVYFAERWGFLDDKYVAFIPSALNSLCEKQKQSMSSFKKWLGKNGLLKKNGRNLTFPRWVTPQQQKRLYFIKLPEAPKENKDFEEVTEQEELIFK